MVMFKKSDSGLDSLWTLGAVDQVIMAHRTIDISIRRFI